VLARGDKYSDEHFDGMCTYCGETPDTKDHVPSKVLLNEPFPENLHKVDCCLKCNQDFSSDEVYFACLLECIINGSANIADLKREKIKRILSEKEHLRRKIEESIIITDGHKAFNVDVKAIENVLLKLARGHSVFEASRPRLEKPTYFLYKPLHLLTETEKDNFFSAPEVEIYPEVGSRLFNHLILHNNTSFSNWIHVQDNDYLYLITSQISQFSVRIIIYNYLAVEVIWAN
jgi:hypothetical protein